MKIINSSDHLGRTGFAETAFGEGYNFAGLLRALRHGGMVTGAEVHVDLGDEGSVQLVVGKHLGRHQFEVSINWASGAKEEK